MQMVQVNISVTDEQSDWMRAQMATGYYDNESHVIHDLISQRQLREHETSVVIAAIHEKRMAAEQRDVATVLAEVLLSELVAAMRDNGEL